MPVELSVVVPTYNEAESLPVLLERLKEVLRGVSHEIIVADDDSPDRTWDLAGKIAETRPEVRALRRTREKGLYPAVLDAFASSKGKFLLVMDADLQHDEALLPRMLEEARAGGPGVVVGSRYIPGGGVEDWSRRRLLLSRAGGLLANIVLRDKVADPMSGFFLLDRGTYLAVLPRLKPKGFKILMDILVQLPDGASVRELPYVFRTRKMGASKLTGKVALAFGAALLEAGWTRLKGR